jgi:hypothetical protein
MGMEGCEEAAWRQGGEGQRRLDEHNTSGVRGKGMRASEKSGRGRDDVREILVRAARGGEGELRTGDIRR